MELNEITITSAVIGAAIGVHRELGAYSTACRSVIPRHADHLFHSMSITDSTHALFYKTLHRIAAWAAKAQDRRARQRERAGEDAEYENTLKRRAADTARGLYQQKHPGAKTRKKYQPRQWWFDEDEEIVPDE